MLQIEMVGEAVSTGNRPGPGNVEFAWRVHSALDSWTGKVDTKASIALALQTAVLAFVVTLSTEDGPLAHIGGSDLHFYRGGVALIVCAILLSMLVVFPQLSRRKAKRNWRTGMIYFGHLRHWDPDELAKALSEHVPSEEQLARQLVEMSSIAWRKHAWLQWSLIALVLGAACLGVAH